MSVSVKMSAADKSKFERDIKKFTKQAERSVEETIAKIAAQTAFEAKKIVPVDKGILKNSILTRKTAKATWQVYTSSGYGLYIEFGSPIGTGPNGGPRPFLRPAFERARKRIFTELRQQFRK